MIGIELVYRLAGIVVAIVAVLDLRDKSNPKRFFNGLFWGGYALSLLAGSKLPDFVNGCIVIVLVIAGGVFGLGRGTDADTSSAEARLESARRWKNRLFLPALLVPALTIVGTFGLRGIRVAGELLVDPKNLSLIALGTSAVIAILVALLTLRQPFRAPAHEGRRLMNLIGWALVLPQMLASLGALFATVGVGDRLTELLGRFVPLESHLAVVVAYTVGMALFTIVMGNAFAAFPMMTAAIGVPLIVRRFGGDPAIMAALGMLSGFCGTLMTPMAANFNIVPAALLELPDRHSVIRVQIPTALVLLLANTVLMYALVFR
jgi:uncharacterized membrane protein